jgi:hypothetical protein
MRKILRLTLALLFPLTLAALFFALPAWAQVALVANTKAIGVVSGSNYVATTPAINTTGANYELACGAIAPYAAAGTYGTMSDSGSNTWTVIGNSAWPGYGQVTLFYAANPAVSTVQTFTYTAGAYNNSGTSLAVAAFSGIASTDQQSSNSTSATVPLASGSVTPTNADELLFNCMEAGNNGPLSSVTQSPLSILDSIQYTSGSPYLADAYQIETTRTSVNPTWNTSTTGFLNMATITETFYSTEFPAPVAINSVAGVPEGFVSTNYTTPTSVYSNCLTASAGVQPYTWSISAGTLPPGLSFSSTGCITGTPTAAQSAASVTFKVTDSLSPTPQTATVTLPMTVASTALSLSAGTCTGSAMNGTQYLAYGGCTLSGSGGAAPVYSWLTTQNYSALPPGLVLNSSTGAITGTNYGQGEYIVLFSFTDALGTSVNLSPVTFHLAGNNTFGGCSLFPSDSAFHINVSGLPVDTSPAAPMLASYASHALYPQFGSAPSYEDPNGIPILTVPYNQTLVPVTTTLYQSYFTEGPWPWYTPIEGSQNNSSTAAYIGDGHSIIVQEAGGGNPCRLWEMWVSQFNGTPYTGGPWLDNSNAYWSNLSSTGTGAYAMPPQGNGTTDAAGLPIAPLLLNADEVIGTGTPSAPNGVVQHPVRFTLPAGQYLDSAHVWPATGQSDWSSHCTGGYEDDNLLILQPGSPGGSAPTSCTTTSPLGEIYRLKASVATPSCASTHPQAAVIFQGFRNYGIILADGGIAGYLIGTPDSRWNDTDLACLGSLILADFEPVNVQSVIKTLDSSNLPTVSYQTITPTAGVQTSGVDSSGGVVFQ